MPSSGLDSLLKKFLLSIRTAVGIDPLTFIMGNEFR